MPFFDFVCNACGTPFEALVQSGQPGTADMDPCPDCGSEQVSRKVSAFSVRGTKSQRRGRVVDMSSGSCPCAGHKHGHHH